MGNRPQGFTLIEILVVMLIISIITTVAMLSMGRNNTKVIEAFVSEFTQSLNLAEEQAMLAPAVLGLTFDGKTWGFAEREKSNWVPWSQEGLQTRDIPNGIDVQFATTSADNNASPKIIISANGDLTPFTLYVGKTGEKPSFKIEGNADGSLTTEHLS